MLTKWLGIHGSPYMDLVLVQVSIQERGAIHVARLLLQTNKLKVIMAITSMPMITCTSQSLVILLLCAQCYFTSMPIMHVFWCCIIHSQIILCCCVML